MGIGYCDFGSTYHCPKCGGGYNIPAIGGWRHECNPNLIPEYPRYNWSYVNLLNVECEYKPIRVNNTKSNKEKDMNLKEAVDQVIRARELLQDKKETWDTASIVRLGADLNKAYDELLVEVGRVVYPRGLKTKYEDIQPRLSSKWKYKGPTSSQSWPTQYLAFNDKYKIYRTDDNEWQYQLVDSDIIVGKCGFKTWEDAAIACQKKYSFEQWYE